MPDKKWPSRKLYLVVVSVLAVFACSADCHAQSSTIPVTITGSSGNYDVTVGQNCKPADPGCPSLKKSNHDQIAWSNKSDGAVLVCIPDPHDPRDANPNKLRHKERAFKKNAYPIPLSGTAQTPVRYGALGVNPMEPEGHLHSYTIVSGGDHCPSQSSAAKTAGSNQESVLPPPPGPKPILVE
jgi:hypothetical protein